jgi:hypothetical protein
MIPIFWRYIKLYFLAGAIACSICLVGCLHDAQISLAVVFGIGLISCSTMYYIARNTKPDFFLL